MQGTLQDAIDLATHAHRKQKDKVGLPYIDHPRRVAAMAATDQERIVAWLHDVVEDSSVSIVYIRTMFGDEVAEAIRAITHKSHEPLEVYYARIKANPLALAVKLLDLVDNSDPSRLKKLEESTMIRLTIKYQKAFRILKGI